MRRSRNHFPWLADAWQDLRFGARTLRKSPGFTAVAVLTLALGVGANTAIFSLFDAILLRRLPVRDPGRLVLFSDSISEGTMTGNPPKGRWELFSVAAYDSLRNQRLPFDSLAATRSGRSAISVHLSGGAARAERADAHLVSGTYFQTMGVEAARGRTLTGDDDRPSAPPAVVVSYAFWQQQMHADPAAVGSIAILNNTAVTIVGVAPSEFFGERIRRAPDFWVPLAFQPQIDLRPSYLDRTDAFWLTLVGRLATGATREQAQAAATAALRQFLRGSEGMPSRERDREIQESRVELNDGASGISAARFRYSAPLHVLLAAVGLVLLIACANVGNLLLTRATMRQTEISVRMALGASRTRLARQVLTESVLLALMGAAGGVLLARWIIDALIGLVAARGSPIQATISAPVLAFTLGATIAAAVLFGLAPTVFTWRQSLVAAIRSGPAASRNRLGTAHILVSAQIATSLVLLVAASLFARSLLNLERQPLGFDPTHVVLARINPRLAGYKPETVGSLYRRLYDRLSALPGIGSVTLARYSPLGGSRSVTSGRVEGYSPGPDEPVSLEAILVGPNYPETLGMPLLQGRPINSADAAGTPKVGLVNQAFVRQYFARENPIGRHFGLSGSTGPADIEIVGVVADAQFHDARDVVKPIVFPALLQDASQFALDCEIAVRATDPAGTLPNVIRRAIADVDPDLPTNEPRLLREQVASTFDSQRLSARLVGFFGALALMLACIGLYGTVAQAVTRRTAEIGVRMALGADYRDVLMLVVRQVAVLMIVGLAVGIPAAFAAARLITSQLFGLSAADPTSFALAVGTLIVAGIVGGFVPARRAARVDPLLALRTE
jgi:predicted permease